MCVFVCEREFKRILVRQTKMEIEEGIKRERDIVSVCVRKRKRKRRRQIPQFFRSLKNQHSN